MAVKLKHARAKIRYACVMLLEPETLHPLNPKSLKSRFQEGAWDRGLPCPVRSFLSAADFQSLAHFVKGSLRGIRACGLGLTRDL